ncbi:nuclear transport factor 2 family protein [uncultured Tateyamaria sp.]|uniref:nuclear transport factor 2 family protein n=1 Tax=uncultured Tateyamaria sp. TaxID=455651 RepID=UPI0026347CD1|nr:nuclear transport factor 2 family protein [uncultured Tateyamaria sp.]
MIRPSPEIESIVRRWTTLIRTHQVADLPHYLSSSEALIYIGTADGESWRGQLVRDGISDHMAEVPDFTEDGVEIDAWENGDTGWANYKSTFTFPGTGSQGVHRATFVFVLERGSWKMIQHHISQPDSNFDKMGVEHSAFRSLIEAAQAEEHDFGTEGLASIMFTDIANSTELAQAVGDRVWIRALGAHMELVRRGISDHCGTLVKSLGDGTMSAFTSAHAALSAARQIQADVTAALSEPPLSVRIGIHTGEVIRAQDDFFGNVVNKAARIADTARPGEVRVSEATKLMVDTGDMFTFADPVTETLKGIKDPQLVYCLAY